MQKIYSSTKTNFIDDREFRSLLTPSHPTDKGRIRDILQKSLEKHPLEAFETAALLNCNDKDLYEEIFATARKLKTDVYGNRIVVFAPLYCGNSCINECLYCAFRCSNKNVERHSLDDNELETEVKVLQKMGHKRLILVFGEHPRYNAEAIANTVTKVMSIKEPPGEIRRVNINAAPLDHEGFRTVKAAGIGTYQIFQETYDMEAYQKWHPAHTRKGDFLWRLDSLSRAMEAGVDDVGIGALFGLTDYRYDVLGLVAHARFLQNHYGVGPHTVSFPRLRSASGSDFAAAKFVSDEELKKIVAILRVSIPYAGLILTARENAELRRELLSFGVSQVDAGSNVEIGGYKSCLEKRQNPDNGQFSLGDVRTLDEVIRELIATNNIPSFCTACYRKGRTGEHFMEYAIPGFIGNLCTPNALTTFKEYLEDYASDTTKEQGKILLDSEFTKLPSGERKCALEERLCMIENNKARDLYF